MMHVPVFILMAVSILLAGVVSGQSSLESVETLKPQYLTEHGSKRVKIRHDPYLVAPDAMSNYQDMSIKLPCHDCLITWIQAGLEYSDGTVADSTNLMWLHHMVLTNINRESKLCPEYRGDRFFASGEERTPISICANGEEKAGYYIGPSDSIALSMELMNLNQSPDPVNVTVTLTYEYIPGVPKSFSKVEAYWLDIGGCGSSFHPAQADSSFNYTSPPYTSNSTGHITFIGSHLHDGGTNIEIHKNDILICNSAASYEGESHISTISSCTPRSILPSFSSGGDSSSSSSSSSNNNNKNSIVSPNDTWSITAYYNTTLHKPMSSIESHSHSNPDKDSHALDPIMGITLVYVATTTTPPSSPSTSPSSSPLSPPTTNLILLLLLIFLVAISILTLSRMHIENKSFADACPQLSPCFNLLLLVGYRCLPASWSGSGSGSEDYYDDDDEGGDEISLKENISRPLLSAAARERSEEGDEGEDGRAWEWDYENENENENENEDVGEDQNGEGSGLNRS